MGRSAGGITTPLIRLQERLSVRKRAEDLATLRELVAPSHELRLLDIGGGAGAATERYATGCGDIIVLDPDPRKIVLGRKLRPTIRFQEGRAEALPFPADSFDRVVAVVAFHHMEDQQTALREMVRVLRRSGRIAFFELPPGRAPGRLARVIAGFSHSAPMSFLTPSELEAKLNLAGLRDISARPGIRGYFVTAAK